MTPPADSQLFRSLLGCFATGVTVATTLDTDGGAYGMTASAVAAVSLEPPLLLICVDRDAKFHAAVGAGLGFALNVLASDQEQLSQIFASSATDPFSKVESHRASGGFPLLDGVVAHIICAAWGSHEAGDHTVFFGTVIEGEIFDRPPLLHYRSQYTTIGPDGRTVGQPES
ncbi:MAG: flavin reductase family protein [Gemmatimonadetes bacterium]|nr:flavin reductase family protein [Gemmatimonadota bacterium]